MHAGLLRSMPALVRACIEACMPLITRVLRSATGGLWAFGTLIPSPHHHLGLHSSWRRADATVGPSRRALVFPARERPAGGAGRSFRVGRRFPRAAKRQ